jgi:hypothetical protein
LIKEIAVDNVSKAQGKSPAAASDTARDIADEATVLLRLIISLNSSSLTIFGGGAP